MSLVAHFGMGATRDALLIGLATASAIVGCIPGAMAVWTFWIYAACSALTFLCILFRLPEIKGRTLEEIETSWRKR